MLTQEDIFEFMLDIAEYMRNENIPILNNIIHDFPGIPSKEDLVEEKKDVEEKYHNSEDDYS